MKAGFALAQPKILLIGIIKNFQFIILIIPFNFLLGEIALNAVQINLKRQKNVQWKDLIKIRGILQVANSKWVGYAMTAILKTFLKSILIIKKKK